MRFHCCLLDRECRGYARSYGTPLRLHVGNWQCTLIGNRRRRKRLFRTPLVYDSATDRWERVLPDGTRQETLPPLAFARNRFERKAESNALGDVPSEDPRREDVPLDDEELGEGEPSEEA